VSKPGARPSRDAAVRQRMRQELRLARRQTMCSTSHPHAPLLQQDCRLAAYWPSRYDGHEALMASPDGLTARVVAAKAATAWGRTCSALSRKSRRSLERRRLALGRGLGATQRCRMSTNYSTSRIVIPLETSERRQGQRQRVRQLPPRAAPAQPS
jgi:hypothetical protein